MMKKMLTKNLTLCMLAFTLALAVTLGMAGAAHALEMPAIWGESSSELTGSRANGSGLSTSDGWSDFVLSWNIAQQQDGSWLYTYTLPEVSPAVSHAVFEVTLDSDLGFVYDGDWTVEGPDWNEQSGNSSPGLPGPIWGLKFEAPGENEAQIDWVLSFYSDRDPVWGLFYGKGGRDDYAYSTALDDAGMQSYLDYLRYPENYDSPLSAPTLVSTDFIVRPNGDPLTEIPTPEPATLLLSGLGLAGLGVLRRRRNR